MHQSHGKEPEEPPRRDIPSWEELWQRAYRFLQSQVARGWQPVDWEDMAQEVVLKVITALAAEAVDISRFDAWFSTVVRHVATDSWRAQYGRQGERGYETWQDELAGEDARLAAELTQTLASRDVQILLELAIALTPHERRVLDLTYWHGLNSSEIAYVFGEGVADTTVRTWHRAALHKLRAYALEA